MKTASVLLIYLLLAITVPCNAYSSLFGHTSTAWVFQWSNLSGTAHDSAYVEKDTTVNGVTYKKLSTQDQSFKGGLIREDTVAGLVWYRDLIVTSGSYDTVEKIAFDFTLQAGDTFDVLKTGLSDTMNIVDSIKVINGLKYIYFRAQFNQGDPYCFIEGIGSNVGIFLKHWGPTLMFGQYLLCSYKDKIRTGYENRRYNGDCNPYLNVPEPPKPDKDVITIYPNPSRDEMHITNTSGKSIYRISITSIEGRVILRQIGDNITTVNLQSIPSGYYLLHVFFVDNSADIKPILVRK